MLETTRVKISNHALLRYRERIDEHATRETLRQRLRYAKRVGKKTMNRIRENCRANRDKVKRSMEHTDFIYLCERDAIFVLRVRGAGEMTLVTCWQWSA